MNVIEYNKSVASLERRVFGFVMKMTKNTELTKDIVQEALLKFWVNKEMIEITKAKSWLFTTSYNHTLNTLKKENRYVRNNPVTDSMSKNSGNLFSTSSTDTERITVEADDDFETKEIITAELNKLSQRDRRLIILRDVHGFSYDEIGTKMGLNKSQVKVYLFRVRKVLKEKFKDLNR